jgi:molybdate transport system substrate-binding protein
VLQDPSVLHVANSKPETAPYGRAALQALVRSGLFDKVKSRLVTAQNVTQALQFTLTAADAGFLNESALTSGELEPWNRKGVHWFAVDPGLYDPIEQGFVVTRAGESAPAAAAFAQFLSSAEARAVFASSGYGVP